MAEEKSMTLPDASPCGRRLQKLELQGFKSFPDKTVIRFHEGITAIVGPNGSGKSNIADALRWVLGETSSKMLRGAKMEDVVFNGTTQRKPLGYAEVSIYLDNSDRMFDVDFAEVSVTRRYYRSGESEYYINKAPVRLRDVRDLFRDTGLGRDGYSVIGQGMITEIIQAKSTDRRFLFEEAAGIAGYKFKKEESERKLSLTADNLVRISDLLSELSGRLPSLEDKARRARKFLDCREEKKHLELFVWQNQTAEYAGEEARLREAREAFDRQLNDNAAAAEALQRAAEAQGETIRNCTVQMDDMQKKRAECDGAAADKAGQAMVAQNDIEHLRQDLERLSRETDQARSGREQAGEQIRRAEEELKENLARQEALKRQGQQIFRARDDLRLEEEKNRQDATQCREQEAAGDEAMTGLQVRLAAAEQARQALAQRLEQLELDLTDGRERRSILEGSLRRCADGLERAENILRDNKNKAGGYDLKLSNLRGKQQRAEAAVRQKQLELNEKLTRRDLLTDMEKHFEGFTHAVRTVMQEAARGALKGNMATVASVITAREGCAVAVEIALGGGLQNIITDREQDAKEAMLLLKNRNAGRATFLPLSVIKGARLSAPGLEQSRGFVGLACDLVDFDPKYEPAIVSLLGRTAVTETIDDALALSAAFRRAFRVVTLDGQVVNAGGSMTGGSVSRQTGILSRRGEIAQLEEECKAQKAALAAEEAALARLNDEVRQLSAQSDALREESAAAEQERVRFRTQKDSLTASLETLDEQLAGLNAEQAAANDRTKSLQEEIAAGQADIEALARQLSEGRKSAEETEELFSALRRRQEEIAEKAHDVQMQLLEEEKNAQQLRERIEEFRRREEELHSADRSVREETERLRETIEQKQTLLAELEAAREELHKQSEAWAQKLRQTAEARTRAEGEQNRLRREENELHQQREALARESERAAARAEQVQESIRSLHSRLWNEYEMTLSEVEALKLHFDLAFAKKRTEELKEQIKALGSVDLSSVEEYAAVKQRHEALSKQYEDLTGAKEELEKIIARLSESMARIFREQLDIINEAFQKTFREMFDGGQARLALENEENILESGVEIYAAPPGKIIKNLVALSGGEQALTAIALYFAILRIRPAPFCLLDEIEAALDDVNVQRFSRYLHRLAANTQFVTITHRRGTMEQADKLYGVTMVDKGISRVITIDVSEISSLNLEKE